MLLPTTLALACATLLTITTAAPSFGTAGQQVVGVVEDVGDSVVGHANDVLSTSRQPWRRPKVDGVSMRKYKASKKQKDEVGKRRKKHGKHGKKDLTAENVRKRLKKADIIPTVIDDFVGSFLLNLTFPHDTSPFLGHRLSPSKVQHHPDVTLYPPPRFSDAQSPYPLNNLVVIMTDPDAPSRKDPEWGEICHWIAVGIPLTDLATTDAAALVALRHVMPYKPPGPPPKRGKHRYVILAFSPINGTTEPLDLVKPVDRRHWGYGEKGEGVKRWAREMGLTPIAGDYFRAKADK